MAGYFKVSLNAAKAIVAESDGPHTLAGYITLCGYAFGSERDITAAGAKAIMQTLGCSDFRSKKILNELRAMRFGERGEQGLISTTKRTVGNAKVHAIESWEGEYGYLPSILLDRSVEGKSPLSRLLEVEDYNSQSQRDALLLLIYVYANTDYAEWFGCPPDLMAYQTWRTEGTVGELDHELGHMGDIGDYSVWLIANPEEEREGWFAPKRVISSLFGADEELANGLFWKALFCLKDSNLLVEVLSIQSGKWKYPLWVFSPSYREHLSAQFGEVGDMARHCHRWASSAGLDPDNYVIIEAMEREGGRFGTGMYFCVGANPKPFLVLAPRLHAPTPVNLDGIRAAAEMVRDLSRDMKVAIREERETG